MRLPFILCVLLLFSTFLQSNSQTPFNPAYRLLSSGSYVQDKNFYLLTLIQELPEVKAAIESDKLLKQQLSVTTSAIKKTVTNCELNLNCLLLPFLFSEDQVAIIGEHLSDLAQTEPAIQRLIQNHLRPSGLFIKYATEADPVLLKNAWTDAARGIVHIIETYGKGIKGRYPAIDSVSYDVNSRYYSRVIRTVAFSVENDLDQHTLFFEPHLQMAMALLDINSRDEAGRHEPMELLDNRKAVEYIGHINWDNYPYAVIMQPGHGPEKENLPLSPLGKMRIKLVAERYHKEWAPLIILSGGYVHPYQTPFAEAVEMKKALIEQYGVPERAIIIDPHARHTTTNFRNAARLMFRYGIPTDKLSVCTSTFDQIIYITDPQYQFDQRNLNELGYLPYQLFEKITRNDIEFKPLLISLFADPSDPLDP